MIGAHVAGACAGIAALVWALGSLLRPRASSCERLAAGVLALVALAWALMAQPFLGVSLLGRPWLLRALLLAGVAALLVRRRPLLPRAPRALPLAVWLACGGLLSYPFWANPAGPPLDGDTLWHAGWVRQLEAGRPAPGGIYAGVPNGYPWLYHSLCALLGQTFSLSFRELQPLLLLLVLIALGAGIWLLVRELGAPLEPATWAVALATATAGLGWIWVHRAVAAPRSTGPWLRRYHGDFLVASPPSLGLGNLPPLLPRELAIGLTPLVFWVALRALRGRTRRGAALAGALAGLVFLAGPVAGAMAFAGVAALALAYGQARLLPVAVLAAAAVAAIWVAPLAQHYLSLGGFVSTTQDSASPDLAQTLVGLGVLLPLGAAGALLLARGRAELARRETLSLLAVPAAACLLAAAAGPAQALLGAPALSRPLRYLPFLALGLVPPAALAASALRRRAGPLAPALVAALAVAACASTALAADRLREQAANDAASPRFHCSALPMSVGDTVAVVGLPHSAPYIATNIFARTGASTLYRVQPRIRFRDIFRRIPSQQARRRELARIAAGGPPPRQVTWVLSHRPLSRPGLERRGSCVFAVYRFELYRVTARARR